MRKYLTILSFIFIGVSAFGQDFEAPKKGAKIYAKENAISLNADGETTFDLWIVRSKYAKKAKFTSPKLISSSGLQFNVEEDVNDKDHFVVTVSAKGVNEGQYSTTISSRGIGTQKVTGTTLSFSVTSAKTVASKDGE